MAYKKEKIVAAVQAVIDREQEKLTKHEEKVRESWAARHARINSDIELIHVASERLKSDSIRHEVGYDDQAEAIIGRLGKVLSWRGSNGFKSIDEEISSTQDRYRTSIEAHKRTIALVESDDRDMISLSALEKLGLLPTIRAGLRV